MNGTRTSGGSRTRRLYVILLRAVQCQVADPVAAATHTIISWLLRPAGLQTSTGFTPRDELSSSLTVPPTTAAVAYPVSQYGSWTNLRTADYDRLDEDFVFKQVRSIRKVKSLPRSVLCSPVTSRRRPHSQWVTDTTDNISFSTNSSPRSVITPVSGSREDFTASLSCQSTVEQDRDSGVTPYHSASLTRSSSLPVDGEDSLDQLRVMPLGSLDSEEESSSRGVNPVLVCRPAGRTAMR